MLSPSSYSGRRAARDVLRRIREVYKLVAAATRAVWSLVHGGDPHDLVARSYGITSDELAAALEWEDKIAA